MTEDSMTWEELQRHMAGLDEQGQLTPSTLGLSLHAYVASRELAAQDLPVSALLAAAMRKADTHNAMLLRLAFPVLCADLDARYDAPGGLLPTD